MKSNGGVVEKPNIQSNDEIIRFAVLVFHLEEFENLREMAKFYSSTGLMLQAL